MPPHQQAPDDAPKPPPFTLRDLKWIAKEELVTPTAVLQALLSLPVRGMAGQRARAAAARLRALRRRQEAA